MARVPPEMTRRARELRNNPTHAELLIWHRVSWFKPSFTRQLVVGRCIIDLACRKAKLAVELDGSQHVDSASDKLRTTYLESLGGTELRFLNSDIVSNPDGVAEAILAGVATLFGPTHPQRLPSREGSRNRQPRGRTKPPSQP